MKKFSEIEYVRPDMEAEREEVRAYTKALKEAKSYEELRGLFMEEKTREDADRKSTRLNSSHMSESRMPSSA